MCSNLKSTCVPASETQYHIYYVRINKGDMSLCIFMSKSGYIGWYRFRLTRKLQYVNINFYRMDVGWRYGKKKLL